METTLEFRGISQETIIHYLITIAKIDINHIITNEDQSVMIKKPDWSVTISKEDTFYVNSIIFFPRLFLTFHGEEKVVQEVIRQLRTKTTRLGG